MQSQGNNSVALIRSSSASTINELGVIRALGRHHVPVVMLSDNHTDPARYSRYVSKRIACPNLTQSELQYVDFLMTLGKQTDKKCVIMPTSDIEVLALSRYQEELEQYYLLPIPSFEAVHTLVNKELFYQWLEQMSIPHPKTYYARDISELESMGREIDFPYIIKPAYVHRFGAEFGRKCFVIHSTQELNYAIKKLENKNLTVMIQEIIPGNELYSLLIYFNKESEPVAACGYDKPRQYPPDFGIGSLCRSAWRSGPIDLSIQVLKAMKYVGIAEPEFKRDPRDGKYKFLEINARTSTQSCLPARCGVDIAYIAYLDTIGRYENNQTAPDNGILWINEPSELLSRLREMGRGEFSVREIFNSYRGKKVFATATWDDPIPLFMTLFNLGLLGSKRLFSKKSRLFVVV